MLNKHRGTCQIEIGGKKRGMVFNMNTYALFCEQLNISLDQIDSVFIGSSAPRAISTIFYCALMAYDEKHKNEIDYTMDDIYDWIVEVEDADFKTVMSAMNGSQSLENDSNNGLSRKVKESTKDDVKKN